MMVLIWSIVDSQITYFLASCWVKGGWFKPHGGISAVEGEGWGWDSGWGRSGEGNVLRLL